MSVIVDVLFDDFSVCFMFLVIVNILLGLRLVCYLDWVWVYSGVEFYFCVFVVFKVIDCEVVEGSEVLGFKIGEIVIVEFDC